HLATFDGNNTGLDPFDTLDDYVTGSATFPTENPFAASNPPGSVCGTSNWDFITCDATTCAFKDSLSQLTWTKMLHTTPVPWQTAIDNCDDLIYAGID